MSVFAPPARPVYLTKASLICISETAWRITGKLIFRGKASPSQGLQDVRAGERVWFDDGKIGGVIEAVETDCIRIRITQARAGEEKLRSDKGINLPDSDLHLSALTALDIQNLPFIMQHADMVALSFANSPADVEFLQ